MQVIDAHCHIIDPRFPLVENSGFIPEPFTVEQYRHRTEQLERRGMEIVGGAVVAGSFQGFDTGWLGDALDRLGPRWAGVVALPAQVSDREISRLDSAGARAVRINLYRGLEQDLDRIERLGRRVHDVAGWHTEFYLDAADLPELAPTLRKLPRISIDHLGMQEAHDDVLLSLVEQGAVVKATGLGRIGVSNPGALIRRLLAAAPTSVVFGTDLPSTRARRPFEDDDALDVAAWAGENAAAVMFDNARELYRLPR